MKKIGFVIPWYADDIPGGAEMLLRGMAKNLTARGIELEVLTTCVKEFGADWNENYYKPGKDTSKFGFDIIRFPVRKRDTAAFDYINLLLIDGHKINDDQQETFMEEMVNSPKLYDYIKEHKDEYSYFVYTPYMFGPTYYGSMACPEKAVLIPCFHDEAYFHMEIFCDMYSKVKGLVYNARPEYELANKYYDLENMNQIVLGTGLDTKIEGRAERFIKKFKITDPFIIYAGRKDVGKNVDTLIKYFGEYLLRKEKAGKKSNLKLVLIGGGKIDIPEDYKDSIIDLGFVSIEEKYDAMAAAKFLCQPSKNESFSFVIMESWLCGRPVLVHEDCKVTQDFALQTNGGLWFKDYYDFEACTDFYLENEDKCKIMADTGCAYVKENFDWDVICTRFMDFLEKLD